ncbi:hypothetical protein [Schumannella sp. 10F1B-5-1]|uniref:hypothetical protein n=1 Tax=Schumannella sp. 10F1B-5-1 TaxID=2590780 RepID=UPI0011300297|nr:hypothetical protein [Schumannella sp. 10F1B-5-1]TPW73483.1 hypothetical protein FJ658_04670 [Schumannella sp. 10F1B-5-1]
MDMRRLALALIAVVAGGCLSGCESVAPADSYIRGADDSVQILSCGSSQVEEIRIEVFDESEGNVAIYSATGDVHVDVGQILDLARLPTGLAIEAESLDQIEPGAQLTVMLSTDHALNPAYVTVPAGGLPSRRWLGADGVTADPCD